MKLKVIILLISLLSGSIEAQTIHYNAFSHNDYERPRPLFDALSFQFNCVEADLWLIDGELYVSHDSVAPNPDITFEKLYLLPLVERIKKNGGKVYPDSDRPFYLMVDCKTDGEAMYPVLKKKLKPYESLFCHEKDGKLQESAVLFYLSGKSPPSISSGRILAEPISICLYTCMESADRISPFMAFASAMDSFVFPTAVGPVRTTSGFFLFCITDIIFSLLFLSCYPLFWVQFAASMANENFKPGMVVEELQKGYMLKDRVIRASLVKVSE